MPGGDAIQRLRKRMDAGDAVAYYAMGSFHSAGLYGLPKDPRRAFELMSKSAELRSLNGNYDLGMMYEDGTDSNEIDLQMAKHHYQLAAIAGDNRARNALGSMEVEARNVTRAVKHFMIGAKNGDDTCLNMLKKLYSMQLLSKDSLEEALRAHKDTRDGMRSEQRDTFASYLASRGGSNPHIVMQPI